MTATFEKEIGEIEISGGGRTGKFLVSVCAEDRGACVALRGEWDGRLEGLGMTPDQAELLAAGLVKGAQEARKLQSEGGFTVKFEPKRVAT
jgi:hypothetical protein